MGSRPGKVTIHVKSSMELFVVIMEQVYVTMSPGHSSDVMLSSSVKVTIAEDNSMIVQPVEKGSKTVVYHLVRPWLDHKILVWQKI